MTQQELLRLERSVDRARSMPSMTRVALDNMANPEHVRKALQAEFAKSVRFKESTDQLIARIQRVANVEASRAATIAQTEKTRAANSQRYADIANEYLRQYRKAVKDHKKRPDRPSLQWVDPRVAKVPRPRHVAISGQRRRVGEEFLPGLKYPGDPDAPASETINCHCYIRRA